MEAQVTKLQAIEREKDLETLRKWIKPGDRLYTILRQTSRSGMSRHISVVCTDDDSPRDISGWVARAIDYRRDDRDGGLKVPGCGMDMGFHVINTLSYVLYPTYQCVGDKCPSNAHQWDSQTGKRGAYGPEITHKDGYALRQEWL